MGTNKILRTMYLLIVINVIFAGSASAFGLYQPDTSKTTKQPGNQRTPEEVAKHENEWMNKDLVLTPEQFTKVNEINLRYAEKIQAVREEYKGNRQALRSRRAELDGQKHTELSAVLSAGQLKKYDETLEARRQKMQEKAGNGTR